MKNRYFPIRILNLLLVIAIVSVYQVVAADRAEAEAKARAEAQAQEAALRAEQGAESPYNDGEYTGASEGYGGLIEMKVVIEDGVITSIENVSAPGEDAAYFSMAVSMIPEMIQGQSPDVDTVSGATMSSIGLRNAVVLALQKALK